MAITTYSELQTAVANWAIRSDLTARIPEFIALAEDEINSEFNHRAIESTSTLTPVASSRYITLPTGFREPLNLWLLWSGSSGAQEMRAMTPETMRITTVNSIPKAWAVDGSNIMFDCPNISDSDYSFLFRWVGAVALSDSTPTNLVLTNYPNVYLYGALKQVALYARDPDMLQAWGGQYTDSLNRAKAKEARDKSLVTLSTEPGLLATRRPSFNVYRGM